MPHHHRLFILRCCCACFLVVLYYYIYNTTEPKEKHFFFLFKNKKEVSFFPLFDGFDHLTLDGPLVFFSGLFIGKKKERKKDITHVLLIFYVYNPKSLQLSLSVSNSSIFFLFFFYLLVFCCRTLFTCVHLLRT